MWENVNFPPIMWWWFQKIHVWKQMQVFTERNFDITFHSGFRASWNYGYRYLSTHFSSLILCAYNLVRMLTVRVLNNENSQDEAFTAIIKMFGSHLQVEIVQTTKEWPNVFELISVKSPWIALRHDVTTQVTQSFHSKN